MPIPRVPPSEAIGREEFHHVLKDWIENSDEDIIGDPAEPGVKAWIHTKEPGRLFRLHADTPRHAVENYLELVARQREDVEWVVVPNNRGKLNAVAFGPKLERVKSLYLYLCE